MRRASRSFSPTLISSSNKTPRSIATLYLDSRSSSEEVVFLACFSKSSFATSISRNLSCIVLFASRSAVISFSREFWALFASLFDCLYFVYRPVNVSASTFGEGAMDDCYVRYAPSILRPRSRGFRSSLVVVVLFSQQPLCLALAPTLAHGLRPESRQARLLIVRIVSCSMTGLRQQ